MGLNIADRIAAESQKKKSALVVGLDPNLDFFPKFFKRGTLSEIEDSLFHFNRIVIEATHDLVVAIKPQFAYYEVFGSYGIRALERTIEFAKSKNLIVICDAKRGDIGSTSKAYADALLGDGPLGGDLVTVNPYLGEDGYMPFIEKAQKNQKGLFLLVKTSNASSADFQNQLLRSGEELYIHFARKIVELSQNTLGDRGYSFIGAVVAANYPDEAIRVRQILKNNIFLVPGYGAQGGRVEDLAHYFDENGLGAVVNSSRGITYCYKERRPDWQEITEAEMFAMIQEKVIADNSVINQVRLKEK
ncbi:MAG TPA: orotidine-5'-phosphate decarboxylase [Bacillota bacterium]|nr:orotidine-5'-phosphate decarboxylase [Bacillota bacterium]